MPPALSSGVFTLAVERAGFTKLPADEHSRPGRRRQPRRRHAAGGPIDVVGPGNRRILNAKNGERGAADHHRRCDGDIELGNPATGWGSLEYPAAGRRLAQSPRHEQPSARFNSR
jgi:hypothetical protein